jgi:hypothetical protein
VAVTPEEIVTTPVEAESVSPKLSPGWKPLPTLSAKASAAWSAAAGTVRLAAARRSEAIFFLL